MRRFALVALVVLTGCSTTWDHPTKGEVDFQQDDYACRRDAYATGGAVVAYGVVTPTQNRGMYERCMQARGYTKQRS